MALWVAIFHSWFLCCFSGFIRLCYGGEKILSPSHNPWPVELVIWRVLVVKTLAWIMPVGALVWMWREEVCRLKCFGFGQVFLWMGGWGNPWARVGRLAIAGVAEVFSVGIAEQHSPATIGIVIYNSRYVGVFQVVKICIMKDSHYVVKWCWNLCRYMWYRCKSGSHSLTYMFVYGTILIFCQT